MNVFESLSYEHKLIANMLEVAQACALRMAQPGAVVEPVGQELTRFCDKFISQCHQVKEFNLFIRLLQKGRSYVIEPIVSLHAEHSRLAQLTGALDAAWRMGTDGQAGACELVVCYLTDYAALQQEHMLKEDCFYRVNESILEAADQAELTAVFNELERKTLGVEGHARYCQWACQTAGAPSSGGVLQELPRTGHRDVTGSVG